MFRFACLIGFALLVGAAPAGAAVVEGAPDDGHDGIEVSVADMVGVRDDLVVQVTGGDVRVRSRRGAWLGARGSCRHAPRRSVVCPAPERLDLSVDTGAGDDRVSVDTAKALAAVITVAVHGGTGADELQANGPVHLDGGDADDLLIGGAGRQRLVGGAGADDVRGGRGNDLLVGDGADATGRRNAPGADRLDGGAGRDMASWSERTKPVHVRLGATGSGGGDSLRSIEDASGGVGDDVLVGDEHANHLLGGPGSDKLDGAAGNDRLDAGGSLAEVDGYLGRALDKLSCGDGDDVVVDAARNDDGPTDLVSADCERLAVDASWEALGDTVIRAQPRVLANGRVGIPVYCEPEVSSCSRTVTLRDGADRLLGRIRRRVRPGSTVVAVALRRPLPTDGRVLAVTVSGPGYLLRWRVSRP
jgi:Ca2+-binding RTX toxin-like protein